MSLKELRSSISIIPQFGFLYRASLKDNIDPENKLTDLKLDSIISEFYSENVDMQEEKLTSKFMIENSGANLSNG